MNLVYRPNDPGPLVLNLGTWSDAAQDTWEVELTIDPRLFTWMINKAAARPNPSYSVKLGKPPLKVELS
jgi:hypothetical protein